MTLLRQTDRPVTDVAWDVGFASLGTFSRTFSNVVGCSPTEFRAGHTPVAVPSCFIAAWTRPATRRPDLAEGMAAPRQWFRRSGKGSSLASVVVMNTNHITSLHIRSVPVLDQDEALDFYTTHLGFEVRDDIDLGFMRWLTVGVPGQDTSILLELVGAPTHDEATRRPGARARGQGRRSAASSCSATTSTRPTPRSATPASRSPRSRSSSPTAPTSASATRSETTSASTSRPRPERTSMSYPPPIYHGDSGEVSASVVPADVEPAVVYPNGNKVFYLAQGTGTQGTFGLYRVEFAGPESGPDAHFHRTVTESFYVLEGTVTIYDGTDWVKCHAGDFAHVPAGGIPRLPQPGRGGQDAPPLRAGCAS